MDDDAGKPGSGRSAGLMDSVDPPPAWFETGRAPSPENPGAIFSEDLYKEISGYANEKFIKLRAYVMGKAAGSPLAASFYSNGCTGVLYSWSEDMLDACAQHDFRYTVGPNVYQYDAAGGEGDRNAADDRLRREVGGLLGELAKSVLRLVGRRNYYPTDTGGAVYTSVDQICPGFSAS